MKHTHWVRRDCCAVLLRVSVLKLRGGNRSSDLHGWQNRDRRTDWSLRWDAFIFLEQKESWHQTCLYGLYPQRVGSRGNGSHDMGTFQNQMETQGPSLPLVMKYSTRTATSIIQIAAEAPSWDQSWGVWRSVIVSTVGEVGKRGNWAWPCDPDFTCATLLRSSFTGQQVITDKRTKKFQSAWRIASVTRISPSFPQKHPAPWRISPALAISCCHRNILYSVPDR